MSRSSGIAHSKNPWWKGNVEGISGNSTRDSIRPLGGAWGREGGRGEERELGGWLEEERLQTDPCAPPTPSPPDTPLLTRWPTTTHGSHSPIPLLRLPASITPSLQGELDTDERVSPIKTVFSRGKPRPSHHLHRHSSIPASIFPLSFAARVRHVSCDSSVFALEHVFEGHRNAITSACLLPSHIVSCSSDYTLKLWSLKPPSSKSRSSSLFSCLAHKGKVGGLAVVADSVVASIGPCEAAVWGVKAEGLKKRRKVVVQSPTAICSPSPLTVLLGKANGSTGLFSLETGSETSLYTGHSGSIGRLIAMETWFLTGGTDSTVKMWDFRSEKCISTLGRHTDAVTALLPWDDYSFLSASLDSSVIVCPTQKWDLRTCTTLSSWTSHEPVLCLEKVKGQLVTGGTGLSLWREHQKTTVAPHQGAINSLCFGAGVLLTSSTDGLMTVTHT